MFGEKLSIAEKDLPHAAVFDLLNMRWLARMTCDCGQVECIAVPATKIPNINQMEIRFYDPNFCCAGCKARQVMRFCTSEAGGQPAV